MPPATPKEKQHPSTPPPNPKNPPPAPPTAPKPPASTNRSQSEPAAKDPSAAANNKYKLHPAYAHLAHPAHSHHKSASSGATTHAKGDVTPGSEASSQACESADVSESERGVMRKERKDVVHQGPGGEFY
ncbi:MAG: hypothetical protein LQ352_007547, partial [Teloschistes flavicans]